MNAYVGQTRARALIARLRQEGFGECCQPSEFPPRRVPWMFDNGAFASWRAGESFNSVAWLAVLHRLGEAAAPPDFAVAPDVVAGGTDSLVLSLAWLDDLRRLQVPAYLAVQDGMGEADVERTLRAGFSGVFVGGTLEWKLATGARWVEFAHGLGLPCHIGRVGTPSRVEWAAESGADTIDSCLPLWSREQLNGFVAALRRSASQTLLFVREAPPP